MKNRMVVKEKVQTTIQDIAGEHIDTDNEYMYYDSVEFIK